MQSIKPLFRSLGHLSEYGPRGKRWLPEWDAYVAAYKSCDAISTRLHCRLIGAGAKRSKIMSFVVSGVTAIRYYGTILIWLVASYSFFRLPFEYRNTTLHPIVARRMYT
jgi:hypothetical protein